MLEALTLNCCLNSKAHLIDQGPDLVPQFVGNRTECALLMLARKWGVDHNKVCVYVQCVCVCVSMFVCGYVVSKVCMCVQVGVCEGSAAVASLGAVPSREPHESRGCEKRYKQRRRRARLLPACLPLPLTLQRPLKPGSRGVGAQCGGGVRLHVCPQDGLSAGASRRRGGKATREIVLMASLRVVPRLRQIGRTPGAARGFMQACLRQLAHPHPCAA